VKWQVAVVDKGLVLKEIAKSECCRTGVVTDSLRKLLFYVRTSAAFLLLL